MLAAMRKLLEGARITGITLVGELTEYTLNTLIGDIRVIIPSDGMIALLVVMGELNEEA
jgi:hypothetical protein